LLILTKWTPQFCFDEIRFDGKAASLTVIKSPWLICYNTISYERYGFVEQRLPLWDHYYVDFGYSTCRSAVFLGSSTAGQLDDPEFLQQHTLDCWTAFENLIHVLRRFQWPVTGRGFRPMS